jgi:hypothetical protein
MFLFNCYGPKGTLEVLNTSNGKSKIFPTMEAVIMAHANCVSECAWIDAHSAKNYYFYDFVWGQAMESVTVPVGKDRAMLTIARPAHRA